MTCHLIQKRFVDYLAGDLDENARREIREHVTDCDSCREELEDLSAVWARLGVLPEEQPGRSVRKRFYASLEDYKKGLNKERARRPVRRRLESWLERFGPRRRVLQAAAALLLLALGLAGGYALRGSRQGNAEVARLREEVRQIREITAASLLRQEALHERLREIARDPLLSPRNDPAFPGFIRPADGREPEDLPTVVIDALFPGISLARRELALSLSEETSPLVEIALALTRSLNEF